MLRETKRLLTPFGPFMKDDGSLAEGSKECAEVLGNFFRSVYIHEDTSSIPAFSSHLSQQLSEFSIIKEMVLEKLSQLNVNKSCEPDEVSPWILKQCSNSLCKPLTILHQQSISSGKLPMDWKS